MEKYTFNMSSHKLASSSLLKKFLGRLAFSSSMVSLSLRLIPWSLLSFGVVACK